MIIQDFIAGEADKGIEAMEGIINKDKEKTGYFFCPYCRLRIPKSEMSKHYGGFCPACGTELIEEGILPYVSKSHNENKCNTDRKCLKENRKGLVNSTERFNLETASDLETQIFLCDEKNDNSKEQYQIRELNEVIQAHPDDPELYFIRATLKVKIGDIEGSRRDFKLSEICHDNKNLELEDYPLV